MHSRRSISLALALSLLFAGLVGALGHDHAQASNREGYACAVDHESHAGTQSETQSQRVGATETPHWHVCADCQLTVQRTLVPDRQASLEAGSLQTTGPKAGSEPSLQEVWSARTLRGPPLA